jgi:hypothetical protein
MRNTASTPWGDTTVLDEVTLPQRADGREFASVVQLLGRDDGSRYVRFAYTTEGTARRGPVTLRTEDVERLQLELAGHAELAAALGLPAVRRGGRRKTR